MLLRLLALALLVVGLHAAHAEEPASAAQEAASDKRQVIGATAWVTEFSVGARMLARVDTGAASCSLHVEEIIVPGGDEKMKANIGKPIRFRIIDHKGEHHWVDSKIASTVIVKNAEKRERRYKVWVDLECLGVEKRVSATLNDRSDMAFPMLIGRNFLKGSFLVDVSTKADQNEHHPNGWP